MMLHRRMAGALLSRKPLYLTSCPCASYITAICHMRYLESRIVQLQLTPDEFLNSILERGALRMATNCIARLLRSSIAANASLQVCRDCSVHDISCLLSVTLTSRVAAVRVHFVSPTKTRQIPTTQSLSPSSSPPCISTWPTLTYKLVECLSAPPLHRAAASAYPSLLPDHSL